MAGQYDDMSFGKAFNAARKKLGAGKVFTWKGKKYTTNTKEDEQKKKSGAPKKSPRPKARPGSTTAPNKSGPPSKGSGRDSKGRTKEMRLADIKKIMKDQYGDKPHLLDNFGRWIKDFRKKNPSPSQLRNRKDPRER